MIPLLGIYLPKRNEFIRPHKDSCTSAHGSSSQGQTQRVNSAAPARPGRPPAPRQEASLAHKPHPCLPVGTKLWSEAYLIENRTIQAEGRGDEDRIWTRPCRSLEQQPGDVFPRGAAGHEAPCAQDFSLYLYESHLCIFFWVTFGSFFPNFLRETLTSFVSFHLE